MPLLIDQIKELGEDLATRPRVSSREPSIARRLADVSRQIAGWHRVAEYYSGAARSLKNVVLAAQLVGLAALAFGEPELYGLAAIFSLFVFWSGVALNADAARATRNARQLDEVLVELGVSAPPGALSPPAAAPELGALTITAAERPGALTSDEGAR